jgi:succinate dehydrogenase / fumarate reductase membrane anchor subunit
VANFFKNFFSFGFNEDGLSHWIWQRISAFLMILLFFWIIFSFQELSINFITDFNIWIKIPINLILFIVLFILIMHHSTLGVLNILEDYVQSEKIKKFFSILLKIISFLIIFISIFSVWHIYSEII